MDIEINLPIDRARADEGYEYWDSGWHYVRLCLVESDGSVLAWDEIAGHYSRHHDLTDAERAEARRLALSTNSHHRR